MISLLLHRLKITLVYLTHALSFISCLVEKKKTGDFYAAKIVSFTLNWRAQECSLILFFRFKASERGSECGLLYDAFSAIYFQIASQYTNCYKSY